MFNWWLARVPATNFFISTLLEYANKNIPLYPKVHCPIPAGGVCVNAAAARVAADVVSFARQVGADTAWHCLCFGVGRALYPHGHFGRPCVGQAGACRLGAYTHFSAPALPQPPLEFLFLLYAAAAVGARGADSALPHRCGIRDRVLQPKPPCRLSQRPLPAVAALCRLSQRIYSSVQLKGKCER